MTEIQASERTLTALKYFCEQTPEYYIVSAGSLLGVAVNREKYSFPVGKVNELSLYPLDFEEFLWALGYDRLADEIKNHYANNEAMPEALHNAALELYQKYFIVGGMPDVVKSFIKTDSFLKVQVAQNNILNEYTADMAKYADTSTSVKCFKAKNYHLAYWQSEGKAEVDFVLQIDGKVVPISKKNFGFENKIKSVPLYAVFCI